MTAPKFESAYLYLRSSAVVLPVNVFGLLWMQRCLERCRVGFYRYTHTLRGVDKRLWGTPTVVPLYDQNKYIIFSKWTDIGEVMLMNNDVTRNCLSSVWSYYSFA